MQQNKPQIVKLLIDMGADISISETDDIYVFDALYTSISNRNFSLTDLLLKNKANPNVIYTEYGLTPLTLSCSLGLLDISILLIQFGADVNGVNMNDEYYQTYPIIEAVRANNTDLVKLLLLNNVDVNIRNKQQQTPLDIAIENKNKELTRILVDHIKKNK